MAGLLLPLAFYFLVKGSAAFQWSSTASLANHVSVPACAGQDVTLAWAYTHAQTEQIIDVEWRYAPNNSTSEVVLATLINGHFFTEHSSDQRFEYLTGAGIRLLGVQPKDTGTYSVRVNLNAGGTHQTLTQSASVVVTDVSVTSSGGLTAHLAGARYVNATGRNHVVLKCGSFTPLWMSKLNVVWTTPLNETVASTSKDTDSFSLAVDNPLVSGEYTCRVDPNSPATLCMAADDPAMRGATVLVDGVAARLALMAADMQDLRGEVDGLRHDRNTLAQHVLTLAQRNHDLVDQLAALEKAVGIRLVHGNPTSTASGSSYSSNSFTSRSVGAYGRLEVLVNGTWGTLCADTIGVQETSVACKQLGFRSPSGTHNDGLHYNVNIRNVVHKGLFGQSNGPIFQVAFSCTGDEVALQSCSQRTQSTDHCLKSEAVGIVCYL